MKRPILVATAAAALFVLAAAGYAVHAVSQKRAEERKLTELVRDTTEQLRQALAPRAPASLVARIDENLQAARGPRNPALVEATELYIVGAREIARRRIEAERLERRAAAGREALSAHMTRGGRRNDAWFNGALELKKRVERDHFELEVTLKALDELLYTLPEAETKLAPHVAAALLLGEAERQDARRQTQQEAKRATAALARVRSLAVR